MSLITIEHTFAAWAEKELAKLVNDTPKIAQVTSLVLKYVGPVLQLIVTAEAGQAAGAEVASIIGEAQLDLITVSSLVYDFGPTPTVGSILKSVISNLGALLTDGHITNTKSIAAVNTVLNNLNGLATAVSGPAPTK